MLSLKRLIYGLPLLRPYRLYRATRAFGQPRMMPEGFAMTSFEGAFSPDYEREERRIIAALLPNYSMLVDVGANHGFYSLMAAHLGVPSIAVEPEETNLRVLRANVAGKPVQIRDVALSDEEGEADLFGDGYMASLMQSWEQLPTHFRQKVKVTTLDNLLEGVSAKLLIKVDVEGAEASVLRGASQTLQGDHIWLIETYPFHPSGAECTGFREVFRIMNEAGYVARLASESGRLFTLEDAAKWSRSTAAPSNFLFYRPSEDATDPWEQISAGMNAA